MSIYRHGFYEQKKRSATPTFDKLSREQKLKLAERSVPLPEGVTPEMILRDAWLLFRADYEMRFRGDI